MQVLTELGTLNSHEMLSGTENKAELCVNCDAQRRPQEIHPVRARKNKFGPKNDTSTIVRGVCFGNSITVIHTLTLILRRSRTGTVWFYTSTSNKRAARPKLYTKIINKGLKAYV